MSTTEDVLEQLRKVEAEGGPLRVLVDDAPPEYEIHVKGGWEDPEGYGVTWSVGEDPRPEDLDSLAGTLRRDLLHSGYRLEINAAEGCYLVTVHDPTDPGNLRGGAGRDELTATVTAWLQVFQR